MPSEGAVSPVNTIPYGFRLRVDLTVVERLAIGTANARIRVVHTEANARSYCEEYRRTGSACIRRAMREIRPRPALAGNCRTDVFTGAFGQRYEARVRGTTAISVIDLSTDQSLETTDQAGSRWRATSSLLCVRGPNSSRYSVPAEAATCRLPRGAIRN